jgi:quercetin dioxygenase-like cupin family protein
LPAVKGFQGVRHDRSDPQDGACRHQAREPAGTRGALHGYTDDKGITTALFKLAPGAVVPLHEHTALEQTYVIEGSLEDHEGKCGPGQFVWRPAGNQHEAVAPNGAVILGFFLKPNRFAYGEKFFTEAGER